jgi:hypothetical protein
VAAAIEAHYSADLEPHLAARPHYRAGEVWDKAPAPACRRPGSRDALRSPGSGARYEAALEVSRHLPRRSTSWTERSISASIPPTALGSGGFRRLAGHLREAEPARAPPDDERRLGWVLVCHELPTSG